MVYTSLYDETKLKEMLAVYTVGEISRKLGVDPRSVRRAMRQFGIDKTPVPPGQLYFKIKDTERGRKLADALGLKVGVKYPDDEETSVQSGDEF